MENFCDLIYPFERVDDLQINSLKIIQNPSWFCYGTDAVMLSRFAASSVKKNDIVVDLCSGSGIVPIVLSSISEAGSVIGVELMTDVHDMAVRSVRLNNLSSKVCMVNGDVKDVPSVRRLIASCCGGKFSRVDAITCNPPYIELGGGILSSKNEHVTIARHEVSCNLRDVIFCAASLLKNKGHLFLIHKPHRLSEIFFILKENRLEAKRIKFIHGGKDHDSSLVLIDAMSGVFSSLRVEPPIFTNS